MNHQIDFLLIALHCHSLNKRCRNTSCLPFFFFCEGYLQLVLFFQLLESGQLNELRTGKGKSIRKLGCKSFYYNTVLLNIGNIIPIWHIGASSVPGNLCLPPPSAI